MPWLDVARTISVSKVRGVRRRPTVGFRLQFPEGPQGHATSLSDSEDDGALSDTQYQSSRARARSLSRQRQAHPSRRELRSHSVSTVLPVVQRPLGTPASLVLASQASPHRPFEAEAAAAPQQHAAPQAAAPRAAAAAAGPASRARAPSPPREPQQFLKQLRGM